MDFISYLKNKKIDPEKLNASEPDLFSEWSSLYEQVHPNSFTQQKLFLINILRKKFIFKETDEVAKPKTAKMMRPKMK